MGRNTMLTITLCRPTNGPQRQAKQRGETAGPPRGEATAAEARKETNGSKKQSRQPEERSKGQTSRQKPKQAKPPTPSSGAGGSKGGRGRKQRQRPRDHATGNQRQEFVTEAKQGVRETSNNCGLSKINSTILCITSSLL